MKFKFPLLRRCALAATLLSLTHLNIYAQDTNELSMQSQHEELITATEDVFSDTLFDSLNSNDLNLEDSEFTSSLVAASGRKKTRKNKRQELDPQAKFSQGDNTWVPKFVWVGEADNDQDLKCFAAFLIGSLADQASNEAQGNNAGFNPGVFKTSQNSQLAQSNHQSSGYNSQELTARKNKVNNHAIHKGKIRTCPIARVYLDWKVGPSFLFFTKYRGNFAPNPENFVSTSKGAGLSLPVQGRPKYNVVPLYSMEATVNLVKWLGLGAYLQSSQGVHFNTKVIPFTGAAGQPVTVGLESDLDLNAVGGQLQFSFADLIKFKTWSLGLFVNGGCGAGFQTWKNTKINTGDLATMGSYSTIASTFPTRYFTNLNYTGDAAISFKSRNPLTSSILLKFGCKFIGFGQTKSLGKVDLPGYPLGLWKPITFEGVFSIVPYMGFSWSF